jgi:predicted MFS family arabinose efflux permease
MDAQPQRMTKGPGETRAAVMGACASLLGIGIARFAYAPLLPAIITAGWFDSVTGAYLGAANLAGYLAGAILAGPIGKRVNAAAALRGAMLVATASMAACAWPLDAGWFLGWRFLSGLAGALLIVLAPPVLLPRIAPSRRGLVSGAIFTGIGFGIVASGTVVPLLLQWGPGLAWLGLALLSLILTAVAWRDWPAAMPGAVGEQEPPGAFPTARLWALYAEYGFCALGLVPHMIFLVDYVARGLNQGMAAGAGYWVLFGLGALAGPMVAGFAADRVGFGMALRFAFALQAVAVAMLALNLGAAGLVLSSVGVGALIPGVVTLVFGRTRELLAQHHALQGLAWSRATISFAIMQAAGGYAASFIFAASCGDYALLFALGGGAVAVALAIDFAVGATAPAKV